MTDIEKVIKALECRKNAHNRCGNPCEETGACHYATAIRDINGEIYRPFICDRKRICTDVIDLLKEQEAKPVIVTTNAYGTRFYHCPKCNRDLYAYPRQLYCSNCGQMLKWE